MSLLGSHVGLSAPEYFLGSVKEALSYKADTFMFYTGAPQNSLRKDVSLLHIPEGLKLLEEAGLDPKNLVVHAPYIINLGCRSKAENYAFAKEFLVEELRRTEAFGASSLVLHPGAHLNLGEEEGLISLVEALDDVLSKDGTNVTICLETMAGKGSELGCHLSFFREVFARSSCPERLGLTLDTCHVHDSGIAFSSADELLDILDKEVGLKWLKVVHLNDSKNPCGARKDRHENLGYGFVGFETLKSFASCPRLENIPVILETPWFNEKAPYKEEIALLRGEKSFVSSWRETL